MKRLFDSVDHFFFARRSAWPFGLMRIAWAAVTLTFLLMQWSDVAAYYGESGFLPLDLIHRVSRETWVVSILRLTGDPSIVWGCYLLLLASLVCAMLGIAPRTSVIVSYVLLLSFHERNAMTLGGGDTVLRNVGFILMLAPGMDALSLKRLRQQYASWRTSRSFLPAVTMPTWPYRLLLWQMIVIYATSLWFKLLGDMWIDGTAVSATLHHTVFLRWPYGVINYLMPFASFLTWSTLAWEALWIFLLVPASFTRFLPARIRAIPFKRLVMAGGVLFHGSIAICMNVGSFSYALSAGYLGLLDDRDRAWLRRIVDRRQLHPIVVLYDGQCRLCRRTAFALAMIDPFKHLVLVDFRNAAARKKAAPHLSESQLDLSLHILLPDASVRMGFDAFRLMSWHLPLLWPLAPFLYVPGISHLGRILYAQIARNRQKCTHDRC